MHNFAPEFQTPEQYIIDITYQIWEERGVGRIRDWYATECPVRTPHGVTNSVDAVIQHTLEGIHEFPDRELLAEDVIIAEKPEDFLSSHRVRSTATHLGAGLFGQATRRPLTMLAIADCLCRDNQIVEEWLLRDQASIALQLGIDPVAFGKALGTKNPDAYRFDEAVVRQRWADPNGLTIVGDKTVAQRIITTYEAIWKDKNLHIMAERYDRALRFEGPSGHIAYGRHRVGNVITGLLSAIPAGRFEPYHITVKQQPHKPVRVALRWSYHGTHSGVGRYGEPTQAPLAILGISHFELRDDLIVNEWLLIDETAICAQLAAHQST